MFRFHVWSYFGNLNFSYQFASLAPNRLPESRLMEDNKALTSHMTNSQPPCRNLTTCGIQTYKDGTPLPVKEIRFNSIYFPKCWGVNKHLNNSIWGSCSIMVAHRELCETNDEIKNLFCWPPVVFSLRWSNGVCYLSVHRHIKVVALLLVVVSFVRR